MVCSYVAGGDAGAPIKGGLGGVVTTPPGHARIFPALTKGNSGYADPCGKWFGRLLTRLGIVDKGVVMHSLRHGGITKLHVAGCHPDHCGMLAGHVSGNEHGRYVHRELIDLKVLKDGLERLTYPDVVKALQGHVS